MHIKTVWVPCRLCMDETFPGYIKKLDSNGREILTECDCHKHWRETNVLRCRLKEASLPFTEFMFNYDPEKDYAGDDRAFVKKIKKAVSVLTDKACDKSHILYFIGGPGTQKTTVSWWMGLQFEKSKISTYYTPMQKILEEIIGSFDEKKLARKSFYENVPILIIDDAFSSSRVSLFRNSKSIQLAPLNELLRERGNSSIPRQTIIISDTPVDNIALSGFGEDIKYFISMKASVLEFKDEYQKIVSKFDPKKDIFGGQDE